jgi:hypothetical protein
LPLYTALAVLSAARSLVCNGHKGAFLSRRVRRQLPNSPAALYALAQWRFGGALS